MARWFPAILPAILSAALFAGQPDDKPETVIFAFTNLDKLKDWTFPPPEAIKFDGTLPLNGKDGKPLQAPVTKDGIIVKQAFAGPKTLKAGETWTVEVQYDPKTFDRYAFKIEQAGDGFALRGTQARTGEWRKKPIALIDSNSNGRFDDAGVDLLLLDKTTAVKIGTELLLGAERWTCSINPPGSRADFSPVRYFADAMRLTDDSLDGALKVWNLVRRSLGVEPVKRDSELERMGALHIAYMQKHGLEHQEEKSSPLYTEDGDKAGRASVLSMGQPSARHGTLSLLDTFYHRVAIILPELETVSVCFGNGFTALDKDSGPKRKVTWTEPLAYPPDGATHVRPGWSGREGPSPIPIQELPRGGVGQTVTLTWPEKVVVVTKAKMTLKDASGAAVDAWVSTPENPAADGAGLFPDNYNSICLIGKAPLKANTEYKVEAEAEVDGKPFKKTWSFRTGAGRGR